LALRRRALTGRGELVEFAQSENLLHHIGDHLIDASRRGVVHGPLGNRHPSRAPQGAYRCTGEDRWVVISVGDDAEWAGLGRAMGQPAWMAEARFADADGRRAGHDELDRLIGGWTSTLEAQTVFARCQAEGVPCGMVLDEAGCLADPHLAARGFFRRNGSPSLGEHVFPGHLWRWDGPELRWAPINEMGADNTYVYRDVLGLDDAEWAALEAEGHLSLDYVDADGNPF
jgi:crotonobetainyl-CoA:carnitine CoA-transferase CaiB-like acyl-CoA transferase